MRMLSRIVPLVACAVVLSACDVIQLAAQTERARGSFERTLAVTGPVDLRVRTGSGDIQIRTEDGARVHIVGRVSAGASQWGSESAAERVKEVEAAPPIVQEGNVITIGDTQGDRRRYNNVSITYELVVPPNTEVSAQTGSGDQIIGSVNGGVRAQTGSGTIRIDRTGGSLDAKTGSGDIRALAVGGAVRAQTGSGDVDVRQTVRSDVHVRTGSGDVTVSLPADAAYSLDARTGSGSISTAHPITMQGRVRRNHVRGTVRGGGNVVRVQTGSGSVDIR